MLKINNMVSVIIPTYNRTTFLNEAIDSVLTQTYQNIELIIVDDSENNEVKSLCSTYNNKIRYFHREEKKGIPSALNFALHQMRGEWYKWMSDDDILPPNAINKFIQQTRKTNALILYPDLEFIDSNGNVVGMRPQQGSDNHLKFSTLFWASQIVITASLFLHRSCFEVVGFFETDYETAFDYKWCIKALVEHKFKFYHIPEILYQFRIHEGQSSIENLKNHNLSVQRIRSEVKKEIINNNPKEWNAFKSSLEEYKETGFNPDYEKRGTVYKILRQYTPIWIRKLRYRLNNQTEQSRTKVICKICKHWGNNIILNIKPESSFITCLNCKTVFRGESFERLVNEKKD